MIRPRGNRPAFPFILPRSESPAGLQPGITIREYLIAHAPVEPQWAFEVKMPTSRPEPQFQSRESEDCLNAKQIAAWDAEYSRQRCIQWPAVWADAMLDNLEEK